MRNVTLRSIPIVAVMTLLLPSCGMWDSFTAYFNTYYNAQRVFTEAEEEIWAMTEYKESGRNMLIPLNISQGSRTKLTSVIEKCSKLLQYHPEAGLVDDALLMIGRSYYYQNDYQKAERKFRELIDGYPESDLALPAQALLSFAHYKSGDTENASKVAQQVLEKATADGENAIVGEAALVLAQIAVDQKAYARARSYFVQVGEYGDTSDKRTQAWMKVGEMLALTGEFAAAEEAYQRAYSISSSYIGEYRASIGRARMLNKQRRFDDAEELLNVLRSNTNNREYYGEIDLESGNVARDRGDLEGAILQYSYVDTAYARTIPAADATLALGVIYETVLMKYDSARAVYERGRNAASAAEARTQIIRRADYLSKYITYRKELAKLDTLLDAALHPADTVKQAHPQAVIDSAAALADTAKVASADSSKPPVPQQAPLSLDTIHVRRAARMDDIGGLFYATIELPDSARFWYRRLLQEYPGNKAAPRALYVLARIEDADSAGDKTLTDSLTRDLIRRFPDSPFAEESNRQLGVPPSVKAADPLEISYQAGAALLQKGKHAAAIDSFRSIVRRSPASPLAPRALYAVAWVYEYQTPHLDSAAANYERLVELYPNSTFAQRVQPRVNEIKNARQAALAPKQADTTASAPAVKPGEQPPVQPEGKPTILSGEKMTPPPGEKVPPLPGERVPPPPVEENVGKH